jgi:hypothetical protein
MDKWRMDKWRNGEMNKFTNGQIDKWTNRQSYKCRKGEMDK